MAQNYVPITKSLDTNWSPLAATSQVLSGVLGAAPDNDGEIEVRFNGGTASARPAGYQWRIDAVDIKKIEVRQSSGSGRRLIADLQSTPG